MAEVIGQIAAKKGMPTTPSPAQQEPQPAPKLSGQFAAVNQSKLARLRGNLTARQRDLLDALPLLFHHNDPSLPGFTSIDAPAGICGYSPDEQALVAAKRIAAQYQTLNPSSQRATVKGLYLMGSPGTVGYSEDSDLDIWLVHDPRLSAEELDELKAKSATIEAIAARLKLEMHFFVFDAERFRSGETLRLSEESSGSSQHHLLLDEFYRSGVLIAGLQPLWWCVPPSEEHRYEEFVESAHQSRRINKLDFVDFGGLTNVPADEFFGAAVWQLYKSIDAPYKSVLKLLLMEAYAADYPHGQLLSHLYKEAIARDRTSAYELDPYIAMYRKVEQYLLKNSDQVRVDLMRRSLYIKTNLRLSQRSERRRPDWQHSALSDLLASWRWNKSTVRHLDRRSSWKVSAAAEQRRDLIKALRQSYAALSSFARKNAKNQKITQTDLNVLGRKLYAAYEKKPSKIEIATRGICPDPSEADLSLHRSNDGASQSLWRLYSGVVTSTSPVSEPPLITAATPVEILVWCHFNRLINNATRWHVHDSTGQIEVGDVDKAVMSLAEHFGEGIGNAGHSKALQSEARPLKSLLAVNAGIDPLGGKIQDGGVLTSNHTDAFQFGGRGINLVRTVDLIMTTSWGEVFVFHFEGNSSFIDAIIEYLQWTQALTESHVQSVNACCLSKDYSDPIERRVTTCANRMLEKLGRPGENVYRQVIFQIESGYCRAYSINGKPDYEFHRSYKSLVRALCRPNQGYSDVDFDSGCRGSGVLSCIFAVNKPDVVQVFVIDKGATADVYALDEYGALFVHTQQCYRSEMIFEQYGRFLHSFLKNHPPVNNPRNRVTDSSIVELYRLQMDRYREISATRYPNDLQFGNDYLPVRVYVDVDSEGAQHFTMFCDDVEFSSAQYGGRLFVAMADYIYSRRAQAETYPIYITELELSNRFKRHRSIDSHHTLHLLNYKKRIEHHLTRALQNEVPRQVKRAASNR